MGSFTRSGAFRDRTTFLSALRSKLGRLREGALRGFDETWEDGSPVRATLSGLGARVVFTVRDGDWTCEADLPSWIPIPQSAIEEKFDREFEELKGL